MSIRATLKRYFVMRELRKESEQQYRDILAIFLRWAGVDDLPAEEFTGDEISEFLAFKQSQGRSCHYRKGLRNTLKALHRFSRGYKNCDDIRPVKLDQLSPASWTPADVVKLVKACDELRFRERDYWRTFILVGYYSGLNAIDIHRITKADIAPEGYIVFNRNKTGRRTYTGIPVAIATEILSRAPDTGPIWPRETTEEAFRLQFQRIVKWAGIPAGSFKQLRKTSGTLVEANAPGMGHRHLGNTQEIFTTHYEDVRVTMANPTMPPELDLE